MDLSSQAISEVKQRTMNRFESIETVQARSVHTMFDVAIESPDATLDEIYDKSFVELGNRFGRPIGRSILTGLDLAYRELFEEQFSKITGVKNV